MRELGVHAFDLWEAVLGRSVDVTLLEDNQTTAINIRPVDFRNCGMFKECMELILGGSMTESSVAYSPCKTATSKGWQPMFLQSSLHRRTLGVMPFGC